MPEPETALAPRPRRPAPPQPDRRILLRAGMIALRVLLLAGVAWLVWHELRSIDLDEARDRLAGAHPPTVLLAIGAAVLALATMGLYDVAAFPTPPGEKAKLLPPRTRWGLGVLFFAWTNFLTLGPIGGPALRLFVYRSRGLEAMDVLRGMLRIYAGSFGGMAAWLLAATLLPIGDTPRDLVWRALAALALGPLIAVAVGRVARHLRTVTPGALQDGAIARLGLLGAVDWGVAMAVFVLCGRALGVDAPASGLARTMAIGQSVGFISMMPGGLGSADAVWLKMLVSYGASTSEAAAHILLFRLVYYIIPWTFSLIVLYARFAGTTEAMLRWQRRLLAAAIALNAAILLAGTATPRLMQRVRAVEEYAPVDALEVSHAVAVIAAALMLFLVRGVLRGYRAAFIVTGGALAASVVAHAMKRESGYYEEAMVSLLLLVLLIGSRRGFTRRGRIPIGWELALGATVGSLAFFMLVGLASFPRLRATELYELYERSIARPETARLVRGAGLIAIVGLLFLLRQALIPRRVAVVPTSAEIDQAAAYISTQAERAATLKVGLGDKGVWFWRPKKDVEGLLIYQRRHRKLIVYADPVVEERRATDLLEEFHAFARDEDLDVVFYQVSADWMEPLHAIGYTFIRIGEEPVVPLLAGEPGPAGGADAGPWPRFEVLEPPIAPEVIDEARMVSDAWLAYGGRQEMQFARGHFCAAYLRRFPLGVARDSAGRMVGFVNILSCRGSSWQGSGDACFDLLRTLPGAEVAEGVLLRGLIAWAARGRFARVSLGVMPLRDASEYREAPISDRLAALLYEHARTIYGPAEARRGLEALSPRWEPRFMAYKWPWDWSSAILSATSLIWARSDEDRRRIEQARQSR